MTLNNTIEGEASAFPDLISLNSLLFFNPPAFVPVANLPLSICETLLLEIVRSRFIVWLVESSNFNWTFNLWCYQS